MFTLLLTTMLAANPDPRVLPSVKVTNRLDTYMRCGWTNLDHGMGRYVDCKARIVCVVQDGRVVACFHKEGQHL